MRSDEAAAKSSARPRARSTKEGSISAAVQAEPVDKREARAGLHERRRRNARKAQIEVPGEAPLGIAIEPDLRQALPDPVEKAPPEAEEAQRFVNHLGLGQSRRLAEPNAERRRQSARSHAPLLPAAVDQRRDPRPRPPAHIERADALGSVNLVARDRHQIDVHRLDIERDLADRLRRVGVEENPARAAERADLGRAAAARRSRYARPSPRQSPCAHRALPRDARDRLSRCARPADRSRGSLPLPSRGALSSTHLCSVTSVTMWSLTELAVKAQRAFDREIVRLRSRPR